MGSRTVLVNLLIVSALFVAGVASAAEPAINKGADNVITGLDVQNEHQATRVILRGKKTPTFTVFKLKNPDRLVVDLIHTDVEGLDVPADVNDARISRIATTQFRQAGSIVSRFIIGLKPDVRFNAKAEGSSVVVVISGKEVKPAKIAKVAPLATHKVVNRREKVPVETRLEAPVAAKKPASDHRVVQRKGDEHTAKRVAIRRVVAGEKDDSVTILASGDVESYQVLEVFTPFRIVLDIYGASMHKKKLVKKMEGKHVEGLRAARHKDKVRVVIDCVEGKQQPYRIEKVKNGIRFQFHQEAKTADVRKTAPKEAKAEETLLAKKASVVPAKAPRTATEAKKPEPAPAPEEPKIAAKPANLKDIDFRQEKSEARVIMDLEGTASPKVTHTDKRSAVLEIPNCKLPLILERTLDTSEFGSAVQSLSAYRVRGENKVKLVAVTNDRVVNRIERRSGRLHWVFETGNSKNEVATSTGKLEVPNSAAYSYQPDQVAGYSVRRPDMASGSGSGKQKRRKYRGKRISLDFKDADIHNILRLISEVAKLNIITSDDVKGKITITMRNVPWDQALDIILKTKKLGKVRHGNIIRVAPMEELAKEQQLALAAAEAKKTLEPLRVRLIPVNYAVAKEVVSQVKDLLSERGTVSVDARTNVVIVKDILQNLVKAEGLIRSLDTETPQVLIEARIVEANTQFVREVGIQWGGDLQFSEATGNPTGLPFPSTFVVQGGADGTSQSTTSGTAVPGRFAINMPAAVGAGSGGALGFIFGSAGGSAHLNLRLSALENQGAVKIISAPKITTLDNQKAKISQGVSIPISVVSAAGVNTQFVEAKLELEVSPHITQEGSVLLQIKVKKNEPDFSRTGARGDPTILKKEAETQVLVRDGDTTVIGGIYTRKTSETITGIPVLSQIPVLGWFFRNKKNNDDRTELLIFITPRIVNRLRATVSQR